MDLKVIARVREMDKDALLMGEEPEETVFVWRRKYIPIFEILDYYELKGKETVVVYQDGRIDIIKEDIDTFAEKLKGARKEAKEDGDYPVEQGIELEIEDGEIDEEEE